MTQNSTKINNQTILEKINNFLLRFSRIPLKEKLFFTQYLGIMLKSGISLSTALNTLSQQTTNKYFSQIIQDIGINVEKGSSLAESLKPHQKIFGELFINMIEAGEISGKLEEIFGELYIQMKKHHDLISKIRGALIYPIVILTIVVGVSAFMMITVVPQLLSMLQEFNSTLPLPTKILISVSNAIIKHELLNLMIIIILIILISKILHTYKGKYYLQALLLKLPFISSIIKKINLARFARTISSLLKTDMLIIKTFQLTANTLNNLHYRQAVNTMAEKLKKGSQINEIISAYPRLFPPIVNQMIFIGEQTGELDNILTELAEFYESEVNKIMDNLPSIIEPLLILILGCAVGLIAMAIMMPMYSITNSF